MLTEEDDHFADLDDIEEDSVQKLEADLAFLKEWFGSQIDSNNMLDEYIDFGINVGITHGKLTNHKILTEVNKVVEENSTDEKRNENDDNEPVGNQKSKK